MHNLEAARGIAALSVCWIHCLGCLGSIDRFEWPLRIADWFNFHNWALMIANLPFNGRNAVVFFLVLSGFVLAGSVMNQINNSGGKLTAFGVFRFLSSRLFRLYPATTFSTCLSLIVLAIFFKSHSLSPFGSSWFTGRFAPVNSSQILSAFAYFRNDLNPVLSTLETELFAALLFIPLIVVMRFRLAPKVAPIAVISILLVISYFNFDDRLLRYFFCFALGIYANFLHYKSQERGSILPLVFFVIGIVALLFSEPLIRGLLRLPSDNEGYDIFVEAFGSFFVIRALAVWSSQAQTITSGPLRILGRQSFSIYLVHFQILQLTYLFALNFYGESLKLHPLRFSFGFTAITLPLAVMASYPMYRWIELPSIALGKWVPAKIEVQSSYFRHRFLRKFLHSEAN